MKPLPSLLAPLILGCSLLTQAASPPQQAAIATPHPAATVAAMETLAAGGNAFDAAVAASAALAVVEPYNCSLGGGGFFLLRQAGDPPTYHFLDARERAPQAARADLYRQQPLRARDGASAAAIPGLPAALVALAQRYGRLPLLTSLAPAIRLAEDGFPVSRAYQQQARQRLPALRRNPASARIFLVKGEVPETFSLIRQPQLANTLKRLAMAGHDGFYRGELAEHLVVGSRSGGGLWSLQDLAEYQVIERQPLRYTLDNDRLLVSAPPPYSGGLALAQSLGILQQLPWQAAAPVQRAHYIVEVLRRAYRISSQPGDPQQATHPLTQLLSADYLQQQALSIESGQTAARDYQPPIAVWDEGEHSTSFSLIDSEGNAVAASLSINQSFGAAFTVPETGVLLNDAMDNFALDQPGNKGYGLPANAANALAPGKRPLSNMSPAFIESPEDFAAFTTSGGSRTTSIMLLSIMQYLQGQSISSWPAIGRYHPQYQPDRIEYEPGTFDAAQVAALESRGYAMQMTDQRFGNQQVLLWRKADHQVQAASDPRGTGLAVSLPAMGE